MYPPAVFSMAIDRTSKTVGDTIKAVIFDVGGVLVRTIDQGGRRMWEQRLGLQPGGAETIVLNSEMGHRAQRGEITNQALWEWVGEYLNLGPDLQTFRSDFWRGDAVDEHLVKLIRKLRKHHKVAVLSNATDALIETLSFYGLSDEFDLIVGSAYEGIMKPDPRIYLRLLEKMSLEPQETVFIDDSRANINAAQSLGMSAIHFSPELDLASTLADIGVAV